MKYTNWILRLAGRAAAAVILLALCASAQPAARPQVVDCVAARVDDQAITLTDVRILRSFDLLGPAPPGAPPLSPAQTLEVAIDHRVVVGLTRQSLPVPKEEVDARLKSLEARFTPAEWQSRLAQLGMTEDDLRPYLEEVLQYEKLITARFGQGADIGVGEIQDYYDHVYVPTMKAAGLEPKPMVQALGEIEDLLKNRKKESQVTAWIQGLRSQAAVTVHAACLDLLK